jgi:D-alanyl-D-alanine dipeptidase
MAEQNESVTAVTGKPLEHYEPYVGLLAQVMANALALAAEPDFLRSLDRTLPLHEALRAQALESIKWRFSWDIDEIEGGTSA